MDRLRGLAVMLRALMIQPSTITSECVEGASHRAHRISMGGLHFAFSYDASEKGLQACNNNRGVSEQWIH